MENLLQQFTKAFGWSILNALWQSAIIYGVLFILLFSLPKLASRYRHNLAFASILLMFGFFCYNFASKIIRYASAADKVARYPNQTTAYLNHLNPSFSSKAEHYFPVMVGFYLIGVLLQLFVIIKGYQQLSKLKKDHLSQVPETWMEAFRKVTAKLNIGKSIRFQISEIVNVPVVIGYLKPVVLFPLALVNQLEMDQVEAILIHELSHIRRNDFLLNLIKTAIETLLFFNPFVWMAGRFIHIEREHACDDLVLRITGKPLNYAQALLKLELLKNKQSPAYALAATGKSQNLYQRIKRITNMKTNYLNAKQQMAALTLGIACLFSIAWINPAEKRKEAKKAQISLFIAKTDTNLPLKTIVYTDTTKKRKMKIVTIDANGKRTEYNSIKEMPDSLKKDFYTENLSFNSNNQMMFKLDSTFKYFDMKMDTAAFASIKNQFNSPEWKAQMAQISKNATELARQYDSPEWKENIARLQKNATDLAKKYDSPEWKENIARIQKNAEDIAKRYDSPEWKANTARIQKNAEEIAKRYDSPEWKANMARIQKNAEDIAKKYDSPEWKANMARIQKNAEDIAKKYDSPEWKAKMENIQKNALEIQKKYDSPEWKQKIKELQELQNSPEYRELQKKYEQDLEELKKKKGIKTDKTFLLFDSHSPVNKMYLPNSKATLASNLKLNEATPLILTESLKFRSEPLTLTLEPAAAIKK